MTRRELLVTAVAGAAAGAMPGSTGTRESSASPKIAKAGPADDIAMLLYPGFTALDLVGPYHFLAGMPGARVHLVTNQPDLRPVPSDLGLAVQPTATMADCPAKLAIIFAPGGTSGTIAAARDPRTLAFIRHHAAHARYVTSVCTGSLILGAAGVLQGRRATSHWSVVPLLANFGAVPVRERVVRDGRLITGAGVSAGMDFGAALVAEIHGRRVAEAGILMAEYAPEPPFPTGAVERAPPDLVALLEGGLSGFVAEAARLTKQLEG